MQYFLKFMAFHFIIRNMGWLPGRGKTAHGSRLRFGKGVYDMIRDLTVGEPRKILWRFTLPMFISMIFQQLYQLTDSIIVGNYAARGEDALAAVGASYPITMIFMAVATGCNIGCSVMISQLFGAKRYQELKTAVSSTLIAGGSLAVFLTVAGVICSPLMLQMIHTPENIFADAAAYLRIYTGGFVFLFLYNIINGIFTALGDSKTPLYFLIGSSLGNVALDLFFVVGLQFGVRGAAWATFICQGIACMLAVLTIGKRLKAIACEEKPAFFSAELLKQIAALALPSVLQQSFVSVGSLCIQSLINSFGSSVIAGYSAAIKLNTFMATAMSTLSSAVSNFTAQNIGAKKTERVKAGFAQGLRMGFVIVLPVFLLYFGVGESLIRLFMKEDSAEALKTGMMFLKVVSPFYFVLAIKLVADGVLRGSGIMRWFMISTFTDLILRVILAYLLVTPFGATGIWMSWPVGWIIGALLAVVFYKKGVWKKKASWEA